PRTISLRFGNMYNRWLCDLETCGGPFADLPAKYDGLRPLNGMPRREPCRPQVPSACPPFPGPDNCNNLR
ncbi:MAG TPA: hypothetical protein VFG20_14555, partial [Planctomycetaceae bacterium]|nr:hypothetical protein [Planctomycetaceae bacterium]